MDKGVAQMAKSPAHRFGQIIGDLLEDTLIRYCAPVARQYGVYLDYKHPRPTRNFQNDVKWTDINGNTHKLDIVMESNGSETTVGDPKAFIEIAWRRYTKHSKNKAQEISAAILPLVRRYSVFSPFYGAVLAGEFTENSLKQMRSEGFKLLYFSIDAIEEAFATQDINAHWDEDTPEWDLQGRVVQVEALSEQKLEEIGNALLQRHGDQWDSFLKHLTGALERTLERISITPLYGCSYEFTDIQSACDYIASGQGVPDHKVFHCFGYEVTVQYSNGETSKLRFADRKSTLDSLKNLI